MNISAVGMSACILLLSFFSFVSNPIHAAIVEVGDLNIIDDAGNASNGLRFLDMTYSNGLTQSGAIANAQGAYANARLATAAEFDDLFAAAGVSYSTSLKASDAFASGGGALIANSQGSVGDLILALGLTAGGNLRIFTDPDGTTDSASSRDEIILRSSINDVLIGQRPDFDPVGGIGWMIVSDAAVVPIPAAGWLFMSALVGLVGKRHLSRR